MSVDEGVECTANSTIVPTLRLRTESHVCGCSALLVCLHHISPPDEAHDGVPKRWFEDTLKEDDGW